MESQLHKAHHLSMERVGSSRLHLNFLLQVVSTDISFLVSYRLFLERSSTYSLHLPKLLSNISERISERFPICIWWLCNTVWVILFRCNLNKIFISHSWMNVLYHQLVGSLEVITNLQIWCFMYHISRQYAYNLSALGFIVNESLKLSYNPIILTPE